jgi:hypothetical protein
MPPTIQDLIEAPDFYATDYRVPIDHQCFKGTQYNAERAKFLSGQSVFCLECGRYNEPMNNLPKQLDIINIVVKMVEMTLPSFSRLPVEYFVKKFQEQFPLIKSYHVHEAIWRIQRTTSNRAFQSSRQWAIAPPTTDEVAQSTEDSDNA